MNFKKITLSIILVWFLIVAFAVIKNEYTLISGREILNKKKYYILHNKK